MVLKLCYALESPGELKKKAYAQVKTHVNYVRIFVNNTQNKNSFSSSPGDRNQFPSFRPVLHITGSHTFHMHQNSLDSWLTLTARLRLHCP